LFFLSFAKSFFVVFSSKYLHYNSCGPISERLSWEDLRDVDPSILAATAAAWPEIRGILRLRLSDRLTSRPTLTDSQSAPEVGRFLGGLLSCTGDEEGRDLLSYLDRLSLSAFLRAEVIRYTLAAWKRDIITEHVD
jgi:hypothetical protein